MKELKKCMELKNQENTVIRKNINKNKNYKIHLICMKFNIKNTKH